MQKWYPLVVYVRKKNSNRSPGHPPRYNENVKEAFAQADAAAKAKQAAQNHTSLWARLFHRHKVLFEGEPEDVKALQAGWKETMKSKHARAFLKAALKKGDLTIRWNRPLLPGTPLPSYSYYDSRDRSINVDPNYHPVFQTTDGPQAATTAILLGHEIGHALGLHDDGPGSMNNVNRVENPIRRDLGLPDRTEY